MSNEYYEGRWAFLEGYGEDENPYEFELALSGGSYARDEWQRGWYSAESDHRK